MSLNRSAIEWTEFTWNPFGQGCSGPDADGPCAYCYARDIAHRNLHKGKPSYCPDCHAFRPHVHPERWGDPAARKKPAVIFACSTADPFDRDRPADQTVTLFEHMWSARHHLYLLLTKQPQRVAPVLYGPEGDWYLGGGDYLSNVWLGVTAEQAGTGQRIEALYHGAGEFHRFVSIEPLLSYPLAPRDDHWETLTEWIIVGAQTGRDAVVPERTWVEDILSRADRAGVPVFLKNNLLALFRDLPRRQEFPEPIRRFMAERKPPGELLPEGVPARSDQA